MVMVEQSNQMKQMIMVEQMKQMIMFEQTKAVK